MHPWREREGAVSSPRCGDLEIFTFRLLVFDFSGLALKNPLEKGHRGRWTQTCRIQVSRQYLA